MMYTVNLCHVGKNDIELVGGKAANLGEMIGTGTPVPQGFCITSHAYNKYMAENGFDKVIEETFQQISTAPESKGELSVKLMDTLRKGSMPQEIKEDIFEKYCGLGANVRVAVRSSATAEDLPDASFAGQQETYLNIYGFENLLSTIKKCFASLWAERAVTYRLQTGFDKKQVSLAVVIQEMVNGEVSGVLFTANPINNSLNEVVINAAYGLGESVVSGLVNPDYYLWDNQAQLLKEKTLGKKEFSVVYNEEGGTARQINDTKDQSRFCLSDEQIQALIYIAKQVENHYGHPQDIEWTIKNGKISILQTRAITTLSNSTTEIEQSLKDLLLDFYPAAPYPLELMPICAVFNLFREQFRMMGIPFAHDPIRIKDNGEFVFAVEFLERSVETRTDETEDQEMDVEAANRLVQSGFEETRRRFAGIESLEIEKLETKWLLEVIQTLTSYVHQITELRMKYAIQLGFQTGEQIKSILQSAKLDISETDLLSGLHYNTRDMNLQLSCLASVINANDELRTRILNLSADEHLEHHLGRIEIEFEEFGQLYRALLQKYGWKSTNSHRSFSAVSWKEDKHFFLSLLKVAMAGENIPIQHQKHERISEQIKSTLSREKAAALMELVQQYRLCHQQREEGMYLLEWCYGLCRKMLKSVAFRFPEIFSCYTDILYLSMDEVYALGKEVDGKLADKIAERKVSQEKNRELWNPAHAPIGEPSGNILKGVAGSIGYAKGKVCIVNDVSAFDKLQPGDILVCKCTDPGWTPLFTIAQAIICDTGGLLSHSAIVAREYGIPAVLACANATSILSDGQEVVVYGNKGEVEMLI